MDSLEKLCNDIDMPEEVNELLKGVVLGLSENEENGADGLHSRAAGYACRHDHRDSRRTRADCRAHHRNTRRAGHTYTHLHDLGRGGGPRCRLQRDEH